jgi:hypothetical protein
MPDEYKQKAAELGFDLTKQFLTLAFGGIAFVVGISFSSPSAVSTTLLWWAIALFSASCIMGLLFLMRGVNHLSEKRSFDIYATSLRTLSILQILFVIAGVIMLCPIVNHRPPPSSESGATIENVTIILNGSNFTFSAKKPEVAHAKTR